MMLMEMTGLFLFVVVIAVLMVVIMAMPMLVLWFLFKPSSSLLFCLLLLIIRSFRELPVWFVECVHTSKWLEEVLGHSIYILVVFVNLNRSILH